VTIEARELDDQVEIQVKDFGIGIRETMKETIFELGVQAPDAHEYKVQGTGIGLWLVRRLLALHDATIEVKQPKTPTIFLIRLPKGKRGKAR
jgi:signal transduction histidine kinase